MTPATAASTERELVRWRARRAELKDEIANLEERRRQATADHRAFERERDFAAVAELLGDNPTPVVAPPALEEIDRSLKLRMKALEEVERRQRAAESAHGDALEAELRPGYEKALQAWLDAWAKLAQATEAVHEAREKASAELGHRLPQPVAMNRYRVGVNTLAEHIAAEFARLYGLRNAWLDQQLNSGRKRAEAAVLRLEELKARSAA